MGPFEKHVFVCTAGKVCPENSDAHAVHARLKELVKISLLQDSIRINHAGCMDQCGHGPMIVVYPENVWYCGVKAAVADVIFREHLIGGKPVERLIYRAARPGANKVVNKA
jgi:(2Fe-2S) ferredoxin